MIVGRLIPAGTGLAHHNAGKKLKLLGPDITIAPIEATTEGEAVPIAAAPSESAADAA